MRWDRGRTKASRVGALRWLMGLTAVAGITTLAACTGSDSEPAALPSTGVATGTGLYTLPAHAPGTFGFGAEASEARVALWDIDVRPDGQGLPPGGGSASEGETVYTTYCVACHGPTGNGGPYDVLVGDPAWDEWPTAPRTVGGYWPYATTLYDYIRKAMPLLTPGVLTEDEIYAVIAYVLYLNGIVSEDAVMNAETLPAVVMPARDRFVPDDRRGGPEVR